MAYIGKIPTVGNFQICDAISVVNGQAAYTMQVGSANVSPESANHMIVSLSGVIQKPGSSYTVSGSTITFSQNLVTGDVIDFIQILGNVLDIGTPSDATVTTAKLGDNAVTSAKMFSGFANGITMADQWRWTANFTGNAQPITANWERNDTSFDKIGTGMTESSGIFTFPQTGIYKINTGTFFYLNSNSRYNEIVIELSTNGGSSWTSIAYGYTSISNNTSSTTYASASTEAIVDVTNASNFKLVISVSHHDTNTTTAGNSGRNDNFTTFVRLGDT